MQVFFINLATQNKFKFVQRFYCQNLTRIFLLSKNKNQTRIFKKYFFIANPQERGYKIYFIKKKTLKTRKILSQKKSGNVSGYGEKCEKLHSSKFEELGIFKPLRADD